MMNRILPSVTHPWREMIGRRHNPPPADFEEYRPCLRWEFGFCCAFCLLHQSDIAPFGSEGWAIMQIEHFVSRKEDATLVNVFTNCFWICGRCNRAKGAKKVIATGRGNLLNPCSDVWQERFTISLDRLLPCHVNDRDASYTEQTYQFNDPRKTVLREVRRKIIWQCRDILERLDRNQNALLDRAIRERSQDDLDMARELAKMRSKILWDLYRYAAIPDDHDPSCLCDEPVVCALPRVLEEQTWAVD